LKGQRRAYATLTRGQYNKAQQKQKVTKNDNYNIKPHRFV